MTVREFDTTDFVHYEVTGVTVQGRRFRISTENWMHARCINLYRGSRWGVRPDGKRVLLERVFN